MASIYKRPEADTYQCQYYLKDPVTGELRKVRKSTGTKNGKKAQAIADDWERMASGIIQAGSDREREARTVLSEAVAEISRETFTGPAARKYLAKLLAIATGETMECYSLESWSAEWLRRKSRDSSKATMDRYNSHAEAFLAWLGPVRRAKPLESISPQDARLWRERLQDEGRAGKTVLSYIKDVGSIYRAAMREGLISFNPFSTAIADTPTDDSHARLPFTLEEVAALMSAAPSQEWRGLILTAAFTGLRLGDCARLSWESVDLEAKKITLIPSKTKKKKREVRIPIQSDLLAYLMACAVPDDSPTAPVFPTLAKIPVNTATGLSSSFVRIMAAAGVSRGKPSRVLKEGETAGAGRITHERGFHSLRHTFTSWLRNAGVDEEDRMALTGHSTRESHAIYSHTAEETLRGAIAKLPTLTPTKQ